MMLLPTTMTRPALRTFWVLVSLGVFTAIVAVTRLAGASGASSVRAAGGVALALAAFGLVRPYDTQYAYRGWNWAARRVSAALTRYLTAVSFHVVVIVLAATSRPHRFERTPAARSMWRSRRSQPRSTYDSPSHHARPGTPPPRWTAAVTQWADAAGHPEARALLPFAALLRWLDAADDRRPTARATDIYTLY